MQERFDVGLVAEALFLGLRFGAFDVGGGEADRERSSLIALGLLCRARLS
jgi:hypothetical protein